MAGVIGMVSIKSLMGCGDFRMPSNHFEGVSSQGYISIWKQLDTLDLGDTRVPILLGAQTYRSIPSGALGSGWIMPLFDSGIVQRDENTFDMITPDGTMDYFCRDRETPSILHGSSGWTAEIQGGDITVYSKCGSGWKMVFRQGRLDTLSKGTHALKIQRDQLSRPIGISENGISRLALTRDEKTGLVSALEMNGKKYLFGYDGKPRIENVGGQNLVGGVEPSLHQITLPDGKKETYDFAVTDKMLPNLKITDTDGKERMIVWGLDGRMLQDGEWSYDIKPGNDPKGNASIGRTNPQKQMEYWFRDEERGQETTVALDGTKTIESWFTSGVAAGKTRKTEITKNGKLTVYRRTYDEKGNLIKESKPEGVINEFIYAPGNKNFIQIVKKGGKEIDKLEYKDGKLVKDIYPGGFDEFTYDSRGREEKRFINGKLHSINSYADDNSWLKIIVYNHDKEIPEREIYNEYNHKGKLLSEKISELSGSKYEAKRTYYYNKLGELAKKIDSEQGTTIYIPDNIDSNVKQSAQSK